MNGPKKPKRIYHHHSKSLSGFNINTDSLDAMPLLTKFSKKHIERFPLNSGRNLNQAQSMRDVEMGGGTSSVRGINMQMNHRNAQGGNLGYGHAYGTSGMKGGYHYNKG
jgi:hypothetical protein